MSDMSEKNLQIKLVKSTIGFPKDQKAAAKQLRLTKLNKTTIWPDTPSVRGQIRKINHLVEVTE
jgi:large subunit ribosomal protein L30